MQCLIPLPSTQVNDADEPNYSITASVNIIAVRLDASVVLVEILPVRLTVTRKL